MACMNANLKTCVPSTLKFHIFCGLHEPKKRWNFELEILNSSGVIATQIYRIYINEMLRMYLGEYKWAIFLYCNLQDYCNK